MLQWVLILIQFLHGRWVAEAATPCRGGEHQERLCGPIPLDLLLSGWYRILSVCSNLSKPARPAGD